MKVNHVRQNVLPLLTAMIWGTAFVAQSMGAERVEPFTFNTARALVAFLFLLGLSVLLHMRRRRDFCGQAVAAPTAKRDICIGGLICGIALTVATNLQQKGLETTSSGKAGFITALYIVIVPIGGIFLKKKAPKAIWFSVALAVAGLYCLCIKEDFAITEGDFYMLLSAFCFSVHILTVDHFADRVDGVDLSCAQFFVLTVLSGVCMVLFEEFSWADIQSCLGPILYVGVFSSGVAYTLQILSQKGSNPTVVSLLLSLEAVFATIAGALILGDRMSGREYMGCALMLCAVLLAQLPDRRTAKAKK